MISFNSYAIKIFDMLSILHSIILITRAGFPTATALSGISFVTIEPVPIIAFSPIVTPGKIFTLAPIQAFFLIKILCEFLLS